LQLISCAPKLRIDIRGEQPNYTPNGNPLPPTPALYVQFDRGGNVPDHARALVEQLPGFRMGVGRDEDPYSTRLGWWDSRVAQDQFNWSEEDHDFVCERLRRVGDPNVLEITEVKVEAPYAKYDDHRKVHGKRTLEHVFSDIGSTYSLAGFNTEQAALYERQNLNDEKVLEFLGSLGAPEPSTPEELIAA
jgi:hypothetical protein